MIWMVIALVNDLGTVEYKVQIPSKDKTYETVAACQKDADEMQKGFATNGQKDEFPLYNEARVPLKLKFSCKEDPAP